MHEIGVLIRIFTASAEPDLPLLSIDKVNFSYDEVALGYRIHVS